MSKVQVPILTSTAPTVEGVKEKEKEKVSEGAVCGKKDPLTSSNRQTGTGTGSGSGSVSGSRTVKSVKAGVGVKGVINGSEDMIISLPSRWPICLPITPHR